MMPVAYIYIYIYTHTHTHTHTHGQETTRNPVNLNVNNLKSVVTRN